jgi:hypothetical protein
MMTSKTMNLSKSLVSLEILLTRTVGPLAPRAPLSHPPKPLFRGCEMPAIRFSSEFRM